MSDCSIIIPTLNRPGYLKRSLGYYNDCRIPYRIIVADGSSEEVRKVNKATISSLPALKILHLDYYAPEVGPVERVIDALKHVDTKYSIFCADDDFITPNGIDRSVEFLENHSDFGVAHGRYISFHLEDDKKGSSKFCWRALYSPESNDDDDPAVRVVNQLSQYLLPTFYAVYRTKLCLKVWEETAPFSITSDRIFCELLASMLTVLYGKMKCLDVLYNARDATSTRMESVLDMSGYNKEGMYQELYAKFRECLSAHLSQQTHMSLDKAKSIIDEAMATYIKTHYNNLTFLDWLGKVFNQLKLPLWLKKGIRKSYHSLMELGHAKKPLGDLTPSSPDYDDINKIRQHVLSSKV